MDNKEDGVELVNLGQMPDEVIGMILKRVPAMDLLKACTQVSKQWNKVLLSKFFWKEKLEEVDGYRLPWQRLAAGQSLRFYQMMAIKQPFSRNFIRDSWDLTKRDRNCCKPDGRWERNQRIVWPSDRNRDWSKQIEIQVPPVFSQQPEMSPEFEGQPVLACLANSFFILLKRITIKLADEGLTNELMDIYRPTIVVSELVAANRSLRCDDYDCDMEYRMHYYLSPSPHGNIKNVPRRAIKNGNDKWEVSGAHWSRAFRRKQFQRGEADSWCLVRHEFKQYPAGMRYLMLQVGAESVKLARCSVMALCESNALKAEEAEAVQPRG